MRWLCREKVGVNNLTIHKGANSVGKDCGGVNTD
jgi:hypothetical protein